MSHDSLFLVGYFSLNRFLLALGCMTIESFFRSEPIVAIFASKFIVSVMSPHMYSKMVSIEGGMGTAIAKPISFLKTVFS